MAYSNTRRQLTLFAAQASNANSAAFDWLGGQGLLSVYGTFGGGTVTLVWSGDNGTTWLVLDATVAIAAAGSIVVNLPAGKIRAQLTGATSSSLTVKLRKM